MTNFLEELYYGNIDPQARGYRKGSHNLKVSKSINELEEKLTERKRSRFLSRRLPPWRKNDF